MIRSRQRFEESPAVQCPSQNLHTPFSEKSPFGNPPTVRGPDAGRIGESAVPSTSGSRTLSLSFPSTPYLRRSVIRVLSVAFVRHYVAVKGIGQGGPPPFRPGESMACRVPESRNMVARWCKRQFSATMHKHSGNDGR